MRTNNLNIPGVLIQTIDNVQYKVNGTIVSINESNNTCSMKFKGYPVQDGIPVSSVYLNEDFLDKIKEYGKNAWETIKNFVKTAAGFLLPVDEAGNFDYSFINTPINNAIRQLKGQMNSNYNFFPSKNTIQLASEIGVKLPNTGIDVADTMALNDRDSITSYWSRVMKTLVEHKDFKSADAVKYVNEHYYTSNNKEALNEASTISLHNVLGNEYGMEMNTKMLSARLVTNILSQLDGTPGHHSDTKPYLIWGAPGIGKTAVIKETINQLKKEDNLDLDMQHIICGSLFRDDFVIPDTDTNIAGETVSGDVPKTWLPVYTLPADPQVLAERDAYYNSGEARYKVSDLKRKDGSMADVHRYDGGIIFCDEFSRMNPQSQNIIMNLINEHVYNGMYLASKWGWVLASNRTYDTLEGTDAGRWEPAKKDRYISVTYVPTKEEWLEWARMKNPVDGLQNVDEMFCTFIENTNDGVWYDALDLQSRSHQLTDTENTNIASKPTDMKTGGINYLNNIEAIQSQTVASLDKLTWTPRSWTDKISKSVKSELRYGIFRNDPETYNNCFTNGNIDLNKLKVELDKLPESKWNRWVVAYEDKLNPSGVRDRLGIFMEFVKLVISEATGPDNLPAVEWEKYQSKNNIFTKKVFNSIWNTGTLGDPDLMKADDKFFDNVNQYLRNTLTAWKASTETAEEIRQDIFNNYPGGKEAFTKQLEDDLHYIQSSPAALNDDEYMSLYKEYTNKYTIKCGKNVSECILFSDSANEAYRRNMIQTLHNSVIARQLANVCYYICKIAKQTKLNTLAILTQQELPSWFGKQCTKSSLAGFVVNSASTDSVEDVRVSKSILGPAASILGVYLVLDRKHATE